jgi:hypothetical protein
MSLVYNYAKYNFVTGNLNWESVGTTWKIMLVTTGYTADPDHQYVSDVSSYEASGTGYAPGYGGSGRISLSGRSVTTNLTTDKAYMDANDITWYGINAGYIGGAIIYREAGGADSASNLVAYINGGGFPVLTNGGDLTTSWSASGILNVV